MSRFQVPDEHMAVVGIAKALEGGPREGHFVRNRSKNLRQTTFRPHSFAELTLELHKSLPAFFRSGVPSDARD